MEVDLLHAAGHALLIVLDPHRMAFLFGGVCMGLALGILPGIGGVAGTAMLLPFTYAMDPATAMALLLTVPGWAAAAADDGTRDEADGAAAILRAAGWRAVTVSAETPLSVAWERLHHAAEIPASGPGGRFPAGAPQ